MDDTPRRRGPGRPATGHDTTSSYRAPAELRREAAAIAHENGESLSDVIRRALESYVRSRFKQCIVATVDRDELLLLADMIRDSEE